LIPMILLSCSINILKIHGIFFSTHAEQKSTSQEVLFVLEMKRADAHEK